MKKIIILLMLAIIMISCGGSPGETPNEDVIIQKEEGPLLETIFRPSSNLLHPISLKELIGRSDYIIHGAASKVEGTLKWINEKIHAPVSIVTVRMRDVLKGEEIGEKFIFESFGAEVGGVICFSEEMAKFRVGSDYILFLAKFNEGVFPVRHRLGVHEIQEGNVLSVGRSIDQFKSEILTHIKGSDYEE